MPIRKVVRIDEEKCDGCGECVTACAEGAIALINGKARLISDTYCDGLGACLGECPQGAITIEEREAAGFDEAAVQQHLKRAEAPTVLPLTSIPSGCPGTAMRDFRGSAAPNTSMAWPTNRTGSEDAPPPSMLGQWPVQLKLVPPHAPFLKDSDLLICADCVPFAVPDFHQRYLAGRAVVVGCPKLDDLQYYLEKLQAIFQTARPKRVTVLRMEVRCCGGIAQAAIQARNQVGLDIPLEVHTIGVRGDIRCETVEAGHAA